MVPLLVLFVILSLPAVARSAKAAEAKDLSVTASASVSAFRR